MVRYRVRVMSAMIGSKIYRLGDYLNLPSDVAKTAVDAGILVREDLPKEKGNGKPETFKGEGIASEIERNSSDEDVDLDV